MKPVKFKQANDNLKAPPGQEKEITSLPVYKPFDEQFLISCWQLSPEELAEVQRTGIVFMHIMGPNTYPVALDGLSPFRETKEKQEEGSDNEKRS